MNYPMEIKNAVLSCYEINAEGFLYLQSKLHTNT